MTKDFHIEFEKICLDTDNNSVMMAVKELEGESIVLHFSTSERVKLLHQMQNNLYNTRQEYKQFMRKLKKDEEERELDMLNKVNEAMQKDMQDELRKVQAEMIRKNTGVRS